MRILPCLQLKRLAKNLHHSPTNSSDLEEACKQADIKPKKMSRSVPTRWNSVAEASGCTIELKDALKVLWEMPHHSNPQRSTSEVQAHGGGMGNSGAAARCSEGVLASRVPVFPKLTSSSPAFLESDASHFAVKNPAHPRSNTYHGHPHKQDQRHHTG